MQKKTYGNLIVNEELSPASLNVEIKNISYECIYDYKDS
jgi:hypothetical protein